MWQAAEDFAQTVVAPLLQSSAIFKRLAPDYDKNITDAITGDANTSAW
jgi:hypothetical protein